MQDLAGFSGIKFCCGLELMTSHANSTSACGTYPPEVRQGETDSVDMAIRKTMFELETKA